MTSLANKTVLITGGASGLGRALAQQMARRGGRIVIWDLHEDKGERTAEELRGEGAAALSYRCDVSDKDDVYRVAAMVRRDVGEVDVLVNNAGIVSGDFFLQTSDEAIERTFKVNTLALFWTNKAFLPAMVERGSGHIVTVASAAGLLGTKRLVDYCASKWAAVGFDESLRMELRDQAPGIRTTVVCPFYIDTGMFAGAQTRFPKLLPILRESSVARRIADAVESDRPRLLLPPLVHFVPLGRGLLPVAAFDWVADFFGINRSMDDFVGRRRSSWMRRPRLRKVASD